MLSLLTLVSLLSSSTLAAVTVYTPTTTAVTTTSAAPGAAYTGYHAYDPTEIQPPPLPNPLPALNFPITLQPGGMTGLSIPLPGSLLGFSVEMSLANVVVGNNGTELFPQFMNLMSTLSVRGGPPWVRVGGNTQEKAALVDSIPGGKSLVKANIGPTGVTDTPTIEYTADIFYAMANISALIDVNWFLGIPMNVTDPPRLEIAGTAERILGSNLKGFQLGNEPDLYGIHGYRNIDYAPQDYLNDFQTMITAIQNDPNRVGTTPIGGPSICCIWTEDQIIQAGYYTQFGQDLTQVIIEHYPRDNCVPGANAPEAMIQLYLAHSFVIQQFADLYTTTVQQAQQINKPVILLETNTASCGGFPGFSDAFGAALWATDLALQLGCMGVEHIMLHIGGQDVYYNPFVPPPHNSTAPHMWTVGPIFYSTLVVAEALGPSGNAQIIDMNANGGSDYTPAYAVYENGAPVRVVLINYMTDPTGNSDYVAQISVGNNGSPQQVRVRYLEAASSTSKTNITWSGQTFGGYFESDGLLNGTDNTQTYACQNNICPVPVKAPSVALVFLTDAENANEPTATQTFATTWVTVKSHNTISVDPQMLATSNGYGGQMNFVASTSKGTATSDAQQLAISTLVVVASMLVGGVTLWRSFSR